jgi:hypothetical protein
MTKKKITTHFVTDLFNGDPVCDPNLGVVECATDRRMVNCLRCKRTKLYKKGLRKRGRSFNSLDLMHSMMGGGCLT